MVFHQEDQVVSCSSQLSQLSDLLSGRGRDALLGKADVADKPRIPLKSVVSNSSLSTMAPSDWCDLEDDEQDGIVGSFGEFQQPLANSLEDSIDRSSGEFQQALASGPQAAGPSLPTARGRRGEFCHGKVPRTQNLAEAFLKTSLPVEPTTVMIRNIPNRYTQKELISELECLGFADSFDFLYLPIDTGSMGNVGYAFVNFVEPAWAARCCDVVTGHTFRKHQQKTRTKVATVSVAHLQGLEANLRHYERAAVNSRGRAKRCGPVVLAKLAVSCSQA